MFRFQRRFGIIRNLSVIESDEGFSVEILGRAGFRYTQGTKTLIVDSEILATGPFFSVMWKSSIQHWDPPYDGELIDEAARDLIVQNICRAFLAKGKKIKVSQ